MTVHHVAWNGDGTKGLSAHFTLREDLSHMAHLFITYRIPITYHGHSTDTPAQQLIKLLKGIGRESIS